jgi:biotin carboxyl carrier protein
MRARLEVGGVAYEVVVDHKAGTVTVDGQPFPVQLERNGAGSHVRVGTKTHKVRLGAGAAEIDGQATPWRILAVAAVGDDEGAGGSHAAKVRPPMNGKLERLAVAVGQAVAKGDVLFILEAMKMQNEVRSPAAGRVAAIHGTVGSAVDPSHVVVEIEPAS